MCIRDRCGSGVVVCSWSLLIRWAQRARCQAETPLIVLCRFPGPALDDRLACTVGQDAGNQVALTLDHAENDVLVPEMHLVFAADERLVDLDSLTALAAKRSVAVNPTHVLADFMP